MDETRDPQLRAFHLASRPPPLSRRCAEEIARLETARRPASEAPVSTGCEGLDRLLPAGGFARGTLVEWIAAGDGSGAETMALFAVREACREGGALVVLDRVQEFYPPASIRLGIDPERMIVVQAASAVDNLWALDQSLRCPGVAVVLAWPEKLDSKTFRRLQLAAEEGASLGFFLRPEQARQTPSWADVRLWDRTGLRPSGAFRAGGTPAPQCEHRRPGRLRSRSLTGVA